MAAKLMLFESRRYLNADAKALLAVLLAEDWRKDNADGRIFTYTVEGFNSVWQRAKRNVEKEKPHLKGIRFHDLRREFISSAFENLAVPSVALIQAFTSLKDTNYLAKNYLKAKPDIATESGLMASVGHTNKATHKRYIAIEK
jgi:integrase